MAGLKLESARNPQLTMRKAPQIKIKTGNSVTQLNGHGGQAWRPQALR
jgi:hypothetical protein